MTRWELKKMVECNECRLYMNNIIPFLSVALENNKIERKKLHVLKILLIKFSLFSAFFCSFFLSSEALFASTEKKNIDSTFVVFKQIEKFA